MGLKPAIPQNAAGCLTDPPVSDPIAEGACRSATTAADPPEEPPGTRPGSCGCLTGPYTLFSFDEPMPNSSQLVLPMITAPAARSRATAVAS